MNQETAFNSFQQVLATPIASKIGEAFENNPLLASAAAFVTTRVALRSFAGILALGLVAGSLLYLQHSSAANAENGSKKLRKEKKKITRQARHEPQAQQG